MEKNFYQSCDKIMKMKNAEASRIATLAIEHPRNLDSVPEYWSRVDKFNILDHLAGVIDKLESRDKS